MFLSDFIKPLKELLNTVADRHADSALVIPSYRFTVLPLHKQQHWSIAVSLKNVSGRVLTKGRG